MEYAGKCIQQVRFQTFEGNLIGTSPGLQRALSNIGLLQLLL